jgi:mRNA interferase MazF
MGLFAKGDVVIASLRFSDFTASKRRPALIVATPKGLDPVLCLITSKARSDGYDVLIKKADFTSGGLRRDSNVRPCHLFSLDPSVIEYKAGTLKAEKVDEVIAKIVYMVKA